MIGVLVADDDFHVAKIHTKYVERVPGFSVLGQAHSAADALTAVAELHPDLVLLDIYLPDDNGLNVIRRVLDQAARDDGSAPPDFIVISSARDVASVRRAMQLGTVHYLVKPFGFAALRERLTAYEELHTRLTTLDDQTADQADVDALYGLLRGPTALPSSLPKGHSAPTLQHVRDAVRSAPGDMSAAEVAALVGISRPTAQRYLAYLARHGVVDLRLRYGITGRPEHRYSAAAR
ncbi:response regulator [Actinoallomurus purpureus]|uniref:response regulator n=1 Tax=Actinoallomurus purpureus TaxID=478114 RepID=UPI002092C7AE|nr:response regulator [Actinoallomurus purpureus]MCO6005954.1 response regulator [Actinoallomurus purpureus]